MATLGALTLKLRATRKLLALDLLQSKQEVEQWKQSLDSISKLDIKANVDWDSFSKAESEIRRWVDSLPSTDLQVGAKFVGADLNENLKELERLLKNPLKILVDDTRLFELNEHFKLKERDYKQLQNVLSSPLEIKVDRSQLDNLSRDLRAIENTPQVNLRANVDLDSLRTFHEQLNRYSQGRTLELATSVSRTTLNALQNDLKSLASNLTTARVSVQIDSQLQALRSELGNLPNVSVGVSIDDSALGEFDRKLGKRNIGLGFDPSDVGNIDASIDKLGKKLNQLKPASGIFKAVTFAPAQIATGFFQGVGKTLSNGLGKGYSQGIESALGDTIGSTELLGRKLAEGIANRSKSAISQLVPTAITDAIKESINQALGEAEVFVESRSKQATASKGQRKKKDLSREGVAEERRQAARDYEDNGFEVAALATRSTQLERVYAAKARVKDIVDQKIDSLPISATKITDRSRAKLKSISSNLATDISQKSIIKSALESQAANLPESSDKRIELETQAASLGSQIEKQSLTKQVIDSKVKTRPKNRTRSKLESLSTQLEYDLDITNQEQVKIGKELKASRSSFEESERRVVRADKVYETLKPQQLPKAYREAISDVPEHLIPEIRVDQGLKAKGASATYSAKSNRIKFSPELYKSIQSGTLSQDDFRVMYHELKHGRDFQFGQYQGLVDRDNMEVRKPVKATAQEVKDVAPFLELYKDDPKLRAVEQNAEIPARRVSKKLYEQQQRSILSAQLNNSFGQGGVKLDRIVNTQVLDSAQRATKINQFSESLGYQSPSAAKIVDRAIVLKDRQKQIGLDIAKAANGELSTQEIEQLQSRINKQVEGVEHLSKRIDALKKSIFKRVEKAKQAIPEPIETTIANPSAVSKSEGIIIDRDKVVEVAATAGQALKQTVNTGKSIISGVKNGASNLVLGAKSGYGLLQQGESLLMNSSPQARLLKSQIQTNIGDRIDDARYQIGSRVNTAGQFAGSVYRGLKAAESVPLSILPGGYAAKKLIQNVAAPAALFSAAHAVPGLNMMLDAASGGIHALAGGAGHLLSSGATSGMSGFVSQALGSVPFHESVVPAVQQGLNAALNATITGGAETAATLGAPVLIGKSIANIGTKSIGGGLQKLAQSNPLLKPAQIPLQLKPKAEPEYEYVEVQAKAVEASVSQGSTKASPTPMRLPERKQEVKQVEIVPPKLVTQITETEAIDRAKQLAQGFQKAQKSIKEALKKGELELAFGMSQQMESFAERAASEIASITSLLGDKAAFGTTLGSQLANTKSQITRARNTGIRATTVYQNSNSNLEGDELASLRIPSPSEIRSGITQKLTEFKKLFTAKDEPIADHSSELEALLIKKQQLQAKLKSAKQPQEYFKQVKVSQPPVGSSNEEHAAYDRARVEAHSAYYDARQEAISDGIELRETNRQIRRIKKSIPTPNKSNSVEPAIVETSISTTTPISPLGRPLPPPIPQTPIPNRPLGRPLAPPAPPTIQIPTSTPPLGRPLAPPAPPTTQIPTPPVNPLLGRPLPPPERIIPELAARSLNPADLIASIEQKLNYFDGVLPQAEDRVRGSEKRGRKNVRRFQRDVGNHQNLFDSSFDRIDRESSKNLDEQTARTQNLNDRVFTENGIVPLGKDVDSILPKLSDLKDMGGKVIATFAGFAGLIFAGKVLSDFGKDAFQAAAKIESLRTTIGAVSSSATKAQATINRSTAESNKLGYNAISGLENDAGFFASTKTTALELVAPDIMSGLKSYNRVMGVSDERAKLSQTAVVQMAGKGKITAEELFGQLAESSPGAVNVLSRSMGLSVGQLRKEMESGSLNANDALPRFGNQLTAESLGSVDAASKSGAASVGRLQNSFAGLQAAVGDKIMAPTIVGLEATTTAADTLKNNIDTLGKVFAAALLSAAASAIGLSAGVGLANPVLGFLIKGLITSLPLLKTFALQTAVAYTAIEVFNTVMGSINDSSPFKSLADESEAAFAKISKGADQTAQDINKLKEEIYGKDRSVFQVIGDGISGALGGQTSITKKADDDTINADRILTQNEQALKRQPPELTEANRNRRSEIELELSVIRSNNANLTSKDRDKIDLNNKREQELVQERSTLEKPINTRQAELQQVIKNANNIIDSPLRNPTEKGLATTQLADAEKEQRKLQEQLVSSASTLAVGLRKVGEGLQAGLAAIDLASINSKTQTYLAAAQDARNTGALAQANFADTTTTLSAKRSLQQQSVDTLKSTIYSPENRGTVQGLGVDPENVSQEQIDRLKSTVTDTRGQSLLGYLSKYQQVKTELAQTNQSLFETQYSYLKSIADYNKGLADQNISLKNGLVNLQLTARTLIVNLQQQIEQTLIEIDTNSTKAMFQAQRNKIQGAYNKFLEKLGISTDGVFDQIFQNYNSIFESIQQISERRITGKQSQNTADNRQINNETRKAQTRAERDQRLEQIQRENAERQLSNPVNQSSSGEAQPLNRSSTSGDNTMYRSQKSGLIIPVIGATNSRGGGYKEDTGLDIMTPIGSKVVASRSGTLEYAENGHSRQIGEDVDPTTPGFQKQKSIRIKLDNPVEYEGKQYQYQYYTHLRQIEQSIYNKGSMSRTKGSQQPIRIEAGQFLGETGTAGGGPHLHTGFSVDREQRDHLNYQQVHDVFFGTKNTSRNAVGKVSPIQQTNTPVAQSVAQAPQLQNNAGTVTSSTYTPGGGGMNGGEIDSRGNRLTRNDYAIAIPAQNRVKDQIPYGSTVKLNYGGRTVIAKVTDGGPYVPGRQLDMTTAAAKALKFNGVGEVGVTLETLPKGADPNKKYYFGEATYKPKFGKGGSVSQSEAKKAIASVVQGDKYLTLGNGVQSDTSPTPGKVIDGTGQVDIAKIRSDAAQGQAVQEQTLNNQLQQQELNRKIQGEQQFSNGLITKTDTLADVDSVMGKQKLRQEQNLSNQQTAADRAKIQTQILKNRNLLNRELPASNRKSIDLERGAEAYNRSQDRAPYQQIDTLYQQYGGVGESATLDNSIIDSRSTIDRLKEESRVRKENILKQIQSIEAYGTGWINLRKTLVQQIKDLKANGFKTEADSIQSMVADNDSALGTPKARQGTINRLSKQFRALPSDGAAVYDAIAPGVSKVIADSRSVSSQYLPKTFDNGLKAEARSIIERFRVSKEALQSEFAKLDEAVSILETEIQSKLKTAGYAPQKLDLTNPTQLALLRKLAPEQTAKFEEATLTRSQVSLAGQKLDLNAGIAAERAVSIGQKREQLSVDRANTDYLATTQDGNLFTQMQVDKQRFTQGKTDLDLQFDQGAISADLYAVKLKQLTLDTNTLRNALTPLRGATTGFFDDIFKGQGVFDGLGNALRNLTINILKNFQDIISKQLGQQLFGSLAAGAEDIQGNVAAGKGGFAGKLLRGLGLVSPGSRPKTNAGIDIGLNQPIMSEVYGPVQQQSKGIGAGLAGSLTGIGLNLGLGLLGLPSIPGFATGGMVTSPTLALVGEGINNEAIVPLPNGRSIPVDLKGAGESSGAGNISNAISVTIQNSGQAKETSRGDSLAIANLVRNLVTDGLINEKRAGGLLS